VAVGEYKQERWSLVDLFPGFNSPEIEEAYSQVETKLQAIEAFRPQLSPGMSLQTFMELLQAYEALTQWIARLYAFSSLSFAADTQDQTAQTALARVQQLAAETHNRTLFFELWWKSLEDELAGRLQDASGDFSYWLETLRLERPFTLSEAEERVINLKNVNGPAALLTLLSTITDRYTFTLEVDGEEKQLTRDELSVYYRHPDPEVRKASYRELFRVYEADKPVLGQIYQYRVRDWGIEHVNLRGYASPVSVRNLANDVPDEVVDLLLNICRRNTVVFQRYFRLKAKWLGLEKLRRFDIYAPVVKTEKRYDFDQAVQLVLTSFHRFEPRVAEMAERVFAEQHLDSEVRAGKRGGAFCATVTPDLTPWVLQSYKGRPDDVATMAHELGHAVHSMMAADHLTLTQHPSLPLAETASTFGEMLVIDRLLDEDPDPKTQRDLLFRQMDSNYATIMRQAFFAIFERDAHERVKAGATIDELSAVYSENLAEQFGDAVEIAEIFDLEWLVIPHIYRVPFYVYAYAFGQLLVLSLYQQYLEEGEGFKSRYLTLLAAGGSDSPVRILEGAGIDIYSEEFWQGGFDLLQAAVEQLESLEIPAETIG
jgi:oligoendopeptidase F